MNEQNDIWEVLSTFQKAFKLIENRLDAQDQAINLCREASKEVENILFDDIINPARAAMDETARESRFNSFNDAYGEKLGSYNDTLRAIEGDPEFDLTQTAFEDFDTRDDEPDADIYVDTLVKNIDEQLANIREKVGAAPDAKVEVTQESADAEPEVEVDGEPVEVEENTDAIGNDEPSEEDVEIVDDIKETSNPDDIEELRKEAEMAIKKAGKLPGQDK